MFLRLLLGWQVGQAFDREPYGWSEEPPQSSRPLKRLNRKATSSSSTDHAVRIQHNTRHCELARLCSRGLAITDRSKATDKPPTGKANRR